ncbi:MAG TPA: hypothetical protein VJH69_03790 [Candidatus Paceibacterota bacterium]
MRKILKDPVFMTWLRYVPHLNSWAAWKGVAANSELYDAVGSVLHEFSNRELSKKWDPAAAVAFAAAIASVVAERTAIASALADSAAWLATRGRTSEEATDELEKMYQELYISTRRLH